MLLRAWATTTKNVKLSRVIQSVLKGSFMYFRICKNPWNIAKPCERTKDCNSTNELCSRYIFGRGRFCKERNIAELYPGRTASTMTISR